MKFTLLSKSTEIIAALFILLFVYTATAKLLSHRVFLLTLKQSPFLGAAGDFLSWAIPVVELLISGLLFIPRFRQTGLVFSLALMTLFTIYIASMLITSSRLPCSCGGIISSLSWQQHLWLNFFLTILSATAVFFNYRLKFLLQ